MNCHDQLYARSSPRVNSRRWFLKECGLGLGKIALASLLTEAFASSTRGATVPASEALRPRMPHYPGKAKHVIYLFMAGAPSQLDLFDPKPELTRLEGKPLPPSVIGGQPCSFFRPPAPPPRPPLQCSQHGHASR